MKTIEQRAFDYCGTCRRQHKENGRICREIYPNKRSHRCDCPIAYEACRVPFIGHWQLTSFGRLANAGNDGYQITFRPGKTLEAVFCATIPPGFRKWNPAGRWWWVSKEYHDELMALFTNFLALAGEV